MPAVANPSATDTADVQVTFLTPEGTTVNADGWSMRVRLDEAALEVEP